MEESIFEMVNSLIFLALTPAVLGCAAVWWLRRHLVRWDTTIGEAGGSRHVAAPVIPNATGAVVGVGAYLLADSDGVATPLLGLLFAVWVLHTTGLTAVGRQAHRRLQQHRRWTEVVAAADPAAADGVIRQLARLDAVGERLRARAASLTFSRFLSRRPRQLAVIAGATGLALTVFGWSAATGTFTDAFRSFAADGELPEIGEWAALATPWLGLVHLVQRWRLEQFFVAQTGRDLSRRAVRSQRRLRTEAGHPAGA